MNRFLYIVLLALTACTQAQPPTVAPQVIKIFTSLSTRQWMDEVNLCADKNQLSIIQENDPAQADIRLGMGDPPSLQGSLFQIGQEDILVVTSAGNPAKSLSREEVQHFFNTNDIKDPQIWAFSNAEDIQTIFNREILSGGTVTSLARLAVSPDKMSAGLVQNPQALGILPARKLTSDLKQLYAIQNIPIVAMTQTQPAGDIQTLLVCLQQAKK